MNRTNKRILVAGALGAALVVAMISATVARLVVTGWIDFLTRRLPQYEFPWTHAVGFCLGLTLLIWGCRRVLRRQPQVLLVDEPAQPAPGRLPSMRSTVLAGAIGSSLCLAGVALTGVAHQLYWLGREDNWQLPRHQLGARNMLYWRVPVTEEEIREELTGYGSDVSFVILRDCNGNRTATLLVPSDPKQRFVGAAMISDDPLLQFETHPRSELRSIIRSIEAGRWPEPSRKEPP